MVLSYMGWQVHECAAVEFAAEATCLGPCDALLLSSNITFEDALRIVPMFRRRNARAKVIQLMPAASAELLPGVDCVISTEDGVLPFLQDLKSVLEPKETRAASNGV
ncbi:MAG TPA: hypothetical protein VMT82_10720 [candidate division Zixibacteria bacterium]|nr:hypothetical protein [candidate division Zixibacteria bacterium]